MADARRRIQDQLGTHKPELPEMLGPPMPPQGIAVCRRALGMPDPYAAARAPR